MSEDVHKKLAPGYSIRVASRLTGISSDTLRMWERRYGFPKPERNGSQVRVYTDADIERLMLVSRALKSGFRAGEVIHREPSDLKGILASSARVELSAVRESPTVDGLLRAVLSDDLQALRTGLRQAVATLGPRHFLLEVAGPLVERVGDAWASGRIDVRHEHLVSEALSTQLRLLLSAYETENSGPVVVLATLSHEHHRLGLEMAALYFSLEGAIPRLLGADTPPDQIVETARALRAKVIGLSISAAADANATTQHLNWMLTELPPEIEIWAGGKAARKLESADPRLRLVSAWSDVDRELLRVRNVDSAAE